MHAMSWRMCATVQRRRRCVCLLPRRPCSSDDGGASELVVCIKLAFALPPTKRAISICEAVPRLISAFGTTLGVPVAVNCNRGIQIAFVRCLSASMHTAARSSQAFVGVRRKSGTPRAGSTYTAHATPVRSCSVKPSRYELCLS